MFCKVRFKIEPTTNRVYAQALMTWGLRLHRYDYWAYTSEIKHTMNRACCKPYVFSITGV